MEPKKSQRFVGFVGCSDELQSAKSPVVLQDASEKRVGVKLASSRKCLTSMRAGQGRADRAKTGLCRFVHTARCMQVDYSVHYFVGDDWQDVLVPSAWRWFANCQRCIFVHSCGCPRGAVSESEVPSYCCIDGDRPIDVIVFDGRWRWTSGTRSGSKLFVWFVSPHLGEEIRIAPTTKARRICSTCLLCLYNKRLASACIKARKSPNSRTSSCIIICGCVEV